MSSIPPDPAPIGRAEKQFRDAFDRRTRAKPNRLPKRSKLSQNNVAREAGFDPSALRRTRFPSVVDDIQQWIAANGTASSASLPTQGVPARRARNRDLRRQIADLKVQRDDALGKLVDAEARVVYLTLENERLSSQLPSNLVPLRNEGSRNWEAE